jgi:filamentous hemagglutinin
MSTNYPGALDSFVNPTATDTLDSATVPHAAQHDNINDAMSAVQVTLGVNPQGGSATVVARLTAIEGSVSGKAANNQTFYIGTTSTAINRSSASQTLTGVSIDGNANTATSATSATTAGNLSGTQTAKFVYAAPNGADGTASFRALVASDIPTLNQDTTGNAGTVTNGVYKNAANTFTTGTQIIATGADGTVGFRIKRNSPTQTANLLEVTQSDGTTILAKIDPAGAITTASGVTASGTITTSGNITTTGGGSITSATNVTAAGFTSTGTSAVLLGSAGSTGGNLVFATTGGTQSLIAATGATGSQTLPSTAGTLLNSATTSIPNVTTANGLTSASSLATVGTITSGTWNATAIDISKGGTGTVYGNNLVGSAVIVTDRAKAAAEPTIEAAFWNAAASAANYIAVDKASLYYVEGVLNLGKSATTATINTQLQYIATSGTGAVTEQSCTFVASTYTTTAGIGINTATAANSTVSSTTTTGTVLLVRFNGVLKTNATTDGRINIGFSASATVSLTLRAGSFLRVHKIGADTTANFGAWTA